MFGYELGTADLLELRKFNPSEPRVPGGEHGGEWVHNPASGATDVLERLAHALTRQDALDATPAKLKRAPEGHYGKYEGEALSGPRGMGSVRALSEYEGVEYDGVNTYLRHGPRDVGPINESDPYDHNRFAKEFNEENAHRVAEIDKTMAVSRLQEDVKVDRTIRYGDKVFGRDAWYGDIIDWSNNTDFDKQDREMAVWESGVRPDLTGLRWKELAYSSTTADPAVAKDFGKRWPKLNSGLDGEPVIMTILVPKGTGGVQLAEMGHAAEILLQRDLTMEVVADHGVDADGFRRIDVRVVPE